MQDTTINMSIWDVFNEYADIRDDIEDALSYLEELQYEAKTTLADIHSELADIRTRLLLCDRILKRFKCPEDSPI